MSQRKKNTDHATLLRYSYSQEPQNLISDNVSNVAVLKLLTTESHCIQLVMDIF